MKYQYIFGRLGKEITKIRKEKELSQENLAFDSNLDRTTIAQIEEGKTNLTIKTLLKIASCLDIKPWQLLKRIDP